MTRFTVLVELDGAIDANNEDEALEIADKLINEGRYYLTIIGTEPSMEVNLC